MKPRAILATLIVSGIAVLGFTSTDLYWSLRSKVAWQVKAGSPHLSDVMIPMEDGVRLATDVYLPDARGERPVVLMRLPYGKRGYNEVRFWVQELTERGFAVVVQDMRGRHASEGVFLPYAHAGADGAATLDWIVAQPWSNGKVGTFGCSALGEAQLMLAARNHPAHRAMIPISAGGAIGTAGGRNGYFLSYEGGVLNLALTAGWFGTYGGKLPETSGEQSIEALDFRHLPVVDMLRDLPVGATDYEDFVSNFENPDYWEKLGYVTGRESFSIPALFIDTWGDPGISSTLVLAQTLKEAGAPTNAIIAAGTHCWYMGNDENVMVGEIAVVPETTFGFVDVIVQYLDHHLNDGPDPELPYLSYFAYVDNRWHEAESWPPPATRERDFFLGGAAELSVEPDGFDPAPRRFVSDPDDPVPSIGGAICCTGNPDELTGNVYQNAIEDRDDLLIYTTETLAEPLLIAGPVSAHLRVSVDTPDTDLVLRLLDVDEAGNSLLVQEGALRLRYRGGFETPAAAQPGEVYDVTVNMRDIAYQFSAGHRLRVHVAGTSFPRLERNLNTDKPNHLETTGQPATITLHSTPEKPSRITVHALGD